MKTNQQLKDGANETRSAISNSPSTRCATARRKLCTLPLKLATSPWGRVVLHVLVAVKTGRYVWHLHGIAREFARH